MLKNPERLGVRLALKWSTRHLLPRAIIALCGALVTLGAYGSWGSLSVVADQAKIVEGTRHILAFLGGTTVVVALIPNYRLWFASLGGLVFVIIAVIAYGEWNYADNQSFYYGADASKWGLIVLVASAALGLVSTAGEVAIRGMSRRPKNSAPPPIQ